MLPPPQPQSMTLSNSHPPPPTFKVSSIPFPTSLTIIITSLSILLLQLFRLLPILQPQPPLVLHLLPPPHLTTHPPLKGLASHPLLPQTLLLPTQPPPQSQT